MIQSAKYTPGKTSQDIFFKIVMSSTEGAAEALVVFFAENLITVIRKQQ